MDTGMGLNQRPAKRSRIDVATESNGEHGVRASFLERFFAKYEFTCKHMLSCSDSEAWKMSEVLERSDQECKTLWDNASLGYTESLGDPLLLQEIWTRYREKAISEVNRRLSKFGHVLETGTMEGRLECSKAHASCGLKYTEQNVVRLTTCVPVEGIYVTMRELLSEGDYVICLAPAYQALYEIARSKGCSIVEWKPRYNAERHFWRFDLEDLKNLLASRFGLCDPSGAGAACAAEPLKMLVLNAPHNPTGACFSQQEFDEIADLLGGLPQDDAPILFSDEMYSEILRSCPSNVAKRNSIVLSGLSKPWGMPGLRVGWLIVENPVHFEKVTHYRDYTTLCLPPQCEILSIIALRSGNAFLERNRKIARSNYCLLQQFLTRQVKWFCPLNQHEHNSIISGDEFAAVTLFARLKYPLGGVTTDGETPLHLQSLPKMVEHLAQKHDICLVAGDFFEFHDFPCVRFGIGRRSFSEALASLEQALDRL